jgi:hypothetical protein
METKILKRVHRSILRFTGKHSLTSDVDRLCEIANSFLLFEFRRGFRLDDCLQPDILEHSLYIDVRSPFIALHAEVNLTLIRFFRSFPCVFQTRKVN